MKYPHWVYAMAGKDFRRDLKFREQQENLEFQIHSRIRRGIEIMDRCDQVSLRALVDLIQKRKNPDANAMAEIPKPNSQKGLLDTNHDFPSGIDPKISESG